MEVGGATALARPVFGFNKVSPLNLTRSFNSHTHNKYSPFVVKAIQSQNKSSVDEEGSIKASSSKRERRPQNVLGDFFVGITLSFSPSLSLPPPPLSLFLCVSVLKFSFEGCLRGLNL